MSPRIAYLDCASGAAGDMILGALVDLGVSLSGIEEELKKLPIGGYRLKAEKVMRSGIAATKVEVVLERPEDSAAHRGLHEILHLLEASGLEEDVKRRCSELFERLARVEAAVHATTPEQVHFHEVGALDSIVDIVGGVCGLKQTGAESFYASPLNVGSGTVTTAHGSYPVPTPATARLVEGVPVFGAGEGELLTPTGALLVTAHATGYGPMPLMRSVAVGYGAGSRDTPARPNLLRIIVGEQGLRSAASERVLVLEAELDDMSPQLFGPLLERLLEAGALDAYGTPVQMKKARPGILVSVVCEADRREALEEIVFAETTTLGVRRQECERTVLERETVPVATTYGTIGVKLGRRGDRIYNAQPEFDDCRRAAAAHGVAVKEVWAEALAAYRTTRAKRQ